MLPFIGGREWITNASFTNSLKITTVLITKPATWHMTDWRSEDRQTLTRSRTPVGLVDTHLSQVRKDWGHCVARPHLQYD